MSHGVPTITGIPQQQAMVPYAQLQAATNKVKELEAKIENMPAPTEAVQARMRSCESAVLAAQARAEAAEAYSRSLVMELEAVRATIKEHSDGETSAKEASKDASDQAHHNAVRMLEADRKLDSANFRIKTLTELLKEAESRLMALAPGESVVSGPATNEIVQSPKMIEPPTDKAPMDGVVIDTEVEYPAK